MGQGGPRPPAEWFGARQQDLGVLPAPGAAILSGLSARPCLPTVTQGLFLPFALLSDSNILGGCAPYPNKPCVNGREHGLLQKNKLILHMWSQAPNLCKQGMQQPPTGWDALPEGARSAAGKLVRLGERSFAPKTTSDWMTPLTKSRSSLAGKAQHPEVCPWGAQGDELAQHQHHCALFGRIHPRIPGL